jgi:hypothetical protein
MRRVFRTSASLLGIALGCAVAQGAAAQSVDIPLNYTLNTIRNFGGSIPGPVVILTINVGVNGGAAQAYAFDTGSAVFLTPNGVFSGANRVASNVDIDTYGGVHTFSGDLYQIPASSLKFYAAPEATSGGVLLSSSGVYNVGSYKKLDGGNPGMQPFGKAVVGAFGADPQAFSIIPNGGSADWNGWHFRSDPLAQHHARLCGLGERPESRRLEFATGYEHSGRSGHQRAAGYPDRSSVCDELQPLCDGRSYAGASRAILTLEHRHFQPARSSISEFQCGVFQQIRAVQFHPELPARHVDLAVRVPG